MENLVTAIDLILGGCCEDGVWGALRRRKNIAAAMPASEVLKRAGGNKAIVKQALQLDGFGSGYGYDSDGSGPGYGGYGFGGYGSGFGDSGYSSGYDGSGQ